MVLAAEREQDAIDEALAHVEQQQRDLGGALDMYEKQAEEVLGGQGGGLRALDTGPADTERDKKWVPFSVHRVAAADSGPAAATCSRQSCTRTCRSSRARSRR
jgi:hypothetical protein